MRIFNLVFFSFLFLLLGSCTDSLSDTESPSEVSIVANNSLGDVHEGVIRINVHDKANTNQFTGIKIIEPGFIDFFIPTSNMQSLPSEFLVSNYPFNDAGTYLDQKKKDKVYTSPVEGIVTINTESLAQSRGLTYEISFELSLDCNSSCENFFGTETVNCCWTYSCCTFTIGWE